MSADKKTERSEFLIALRNGALIGVVILAIAWPWLRHKPQQPQPPAPPPAVSSVPTPRPAPLPPPMPGILADFAGDIPSADVRHVANWSFYTGDNQGKSVVILDKKAAKVYAFDPHGKLVATTHALLGAAVGDDSAPGIGDKPLSAVRPEEKTTPAGRFVAEPGVNTKGEDIVWIDYDAAVSMHRVRNVKNEGRMKRLLSETIEDNRISFGCVNLPVKFYEKVLSPTVQKTGAIVYVLPETRTPQQVFASWDVTDPNAKPQLVRVAAHTPQPAPPAKAAPKQERETP